MYTFEQIATILRRTADIIEHPGDLNRDDELDIACLALDMAQELDPLTD